MASGKVAMFNDHRGFGFIKPDAGGDDMFFHITEVADDGGDIAVGRAVAFEVGTDPRTGRALAINVDLV